MCFTRTRFFFKTICFYELGSDVHSHLIIISKLISWRNKHTHHYIPANGSQTYQGKPSIFNGFLCIFLDFFYKLYSIFNISMVFLANFVCNCVTKDNSFVVSDVNFYFISYCVSLVVCFIYGCTNLVLFFQRKIILTIALNIFHKPSHTLYQNLGKWSIRISSLLNSFLSHFLTHPSIYSWIRASMPCWSCLSFCSNQYVTLRPILLS